MEEFDKSKIEWQIEFMPASYATLDRMKNELEWANSSVECWKDWNIELKLATILVRPIIQESTNQIYPHD